MRGTRNSGRLIPLFRFLRRWKKALFRNPDTEIHVSPIDCRIDEDHVLILTLRANDIKISFYEPT